MQEETREPKPRRSPRTGAPEPEDLLATSELDSLDALPTERLRELRSDCEQAEGGVSYARRVLQGRLDILRAELSSRRSEGAQDVLDLLPEILTSDDGPRDPMQARATSVGVPDDADAYQAAIDAVAPSHGLDERDEEQLQSIVERLAEHEHELSSVRRQLFDRIDALRDELAARYRDGRADVRELLR